MTTERTLLDAIIAAPEDDALRLAYARRCDREGATDRATFIRLQCEAANLDREDPRRNELYARYKSLIAGREVEWSGVSPELVKVTPFAFRRGFLEVAQVNDPYAFVERAAEVLNAAPIREVVFSGAGGARHSAPLARLPDFRRVRALRIFNADAWWLDRFLDGDCLDRLEDLALDASGLTGRGVELLANASSLPALRALSLTNNRLTAADVEVLGGGTLLDQLGLLDLSTNGGVGPAGAAAIASAPAAGRLETLHLRFCGLGPGGIAALASSQHLGPLRTLDVGWNKLGKAGLVALGKATGLPGLRSLLLSGNKLSGAAVAAFVASPLFPQLESVNLQQNNLGARGAEALLGAPPNSSLRWLDLFDTSIEPAALESLQLRFANVRG